MTYARLARTLTQKEYDEFICRDYKPSVYESGELRDGRFAEGTYYHFLCRTRCYMVYREIVSRLSPGSRVVDIGVFPGTIIRQLKTLLKDGIFCCGVGQKVDPGFEEFMRPYVERCVNAELDPFYAAPGQEIRVPFADGTFDAVIATEILEHLISPLELISEGARLLREGGLFIITTPNVSHIGALLKLMLGRSNYERIERSPMCMRGDSWRGHVRFYDKAELEELFGRSGLRLILHRYYTEAGWRRTRQPPLKRLLTGLAVALPPAYRGDHFAVFEKRGEGRGAK